MIGSFVIFVLESGGWSGPETENLLTVPWCRHVIRKGCHLLPSANAIHPSDYLTLHNSPTGPQAAIMRQNGVPWKFERVPGPEGTKSTCLSVLPHRESTMSSERSGWDLSEVILTCLFIQNFFIGEEGGGGGGRLCPIGSIWFSFRPPRDVSHQKPGVSRNTLSLSANSSLRHQLLPLHLTDCKPGVWSLRENVS